MLTPGKGLETSQVKSGQKSLAVRRNRRNDLVERKSLFFRNSTKNQSGCSIVNVGGE